MAPVSCISVASVAVVVFSILQLHSVTALEWLTIPATFLYANLAEYLGHRGPMHHPAGFLRLIYERHTLQHHRFFTDEAMQFDSSRDFHAVLFPPVLMVFFITAFALPVWALLVWLFSANEGYLDKVQVSKIVDYEAALHDFARANHQEALDAINATGDYNDEVEATLKSICDAFAEKGAY